MLGFFVLSHSIILSIIFPTTIHFYLIPHKKTRAPGFLLFVVFNHVVLLHPIKYLIRNLKADLCLLLLRQGGLCPPMWWGVRL